MKKLVFTLFMSLMAFTAHAQSTLLGDVNSDGKVTVADAMMVVNIIMNGYAPFSVEPISVSMPVGGTVTLEISGGYNKYEVMSANTTLVAASLEGRTITLTAIASGETKVIVKDVLTMRYVEIPVSVEYASLQLSTSELSLIVGDEGIVDITSGSGNYSVISSNMNVTTAIVDGSSVKVAAVSVGSATITVTDMESGKTQNITVTIDYQLLVLSSTSKNLFIGEESTVEITSGGGSYSVECSDGNVAVADVDGKMITITAFGSGTAIIIVNDTKSNQTAIIEVTVKSLCPDDHHPHQIDLGLPSGTKWACCNVDTDHPENQSPTNYGGEYAWGETETKSYYDWSTYIHLDGSWDICKDLGSDIAGTEYDVAHVKWGGSWVMPTGEQIEELRSNCSKEWKTVNGVKGCMFSSKTNDGSIFLPADFISKYWSSRLDGDENAVVFEICVWEEETRLHGFVDMYDEYRCLGRNVRPVSR